MPILPTPTLIPALFLTAHLNLSVPPVPVMPSPPVIVEREISLSNRYPNSWINNIFRDNILLNLAYLRRLIPSSKEIDWDKVREPFTYEFKIEPQETFVFHEDVLPEFFGKTIILTNAHFNFTDGFKTDGYLFGDGVCHLASLIHWVSKEAGLEVKAPTRHDFANIPEVPREYGTSIYYSPNVKGANAKQNLYVTNNQNYPIIFRFVYRDDKLKFMVVK